MEQTGTKLSVNQERIIGNIREILINCDFICAAYLFGSFLRSGTYNDIDLGVYLSYNPDPYERFKLGNQIGQKVEQGIHPRTHVDVRILNNAPVTFTYEVISTGLLLINSNNSKFTEFETDTLIRYLDMQPWFELLDQQYLERIAG
jgi:uncharacterized protein